MERQATERASFSVTRNARIMSGLFAFCMKKRCYFRLSSASDVAFASKRGGSYDLSRPTKDRIMFLGWNVRSAIAALKPGEGIQLRHRSFVDVVFFAPGPKSNVNRDDHYSGPPLRIIKRFVKIAKWRG